MTVEGVNAVIDSGLARIATYSQWTGLPTLHVGRVSKASAQQRAGRAGRTGPGGIASLRDRGLSTPARPRRAGDRPQRSLPALPCSAGHADRRPRVVRCSAGGSVANRRGTARPAGCDQAASWRGIRCIRGSRAFSSRLWSAEWVRTVAWLLHCSERVRARRKMICLQPSTPQPGLPNQAADRAAAQDRTPGQTGAAQ